MVYESVGEDCKTGEVPDFYSFPSCDSSSEENGQLEESHQSDAHSSNSTDVESSSSYSDLDETRAQNMNASREEVSCFKRH